MPKGCTMKMNKVCPACYSDTGYSIVLDETDPNGVFKCPNNAQHKYKLSEDGFLERVEGW